MKTDKTPLNRALRSSLPALAATFILSLFINVCMLVSPIYSMQVYDRVMSSRSVTTLVMLTVIVTVFLALYGVLEYARSGVLTRAGLRFEGILRRPLFNAMMRAELSPAHRLGAQAIRDAELLRETVSSALAPTLFDLPWTPVFITLCFLLHPMLGWVALIGGVVLFMLAVVSEKITKSRFEHAGRLSREAGMMVQAALRNGDAVRGLGMGDIVLDRWAGAQSAVVALHAEASERSLCIGRHFKIHPHGGSGGASVRRRLALHRTGESRPARSWRPPSSWPALLRPSSKPSRNGSKSACLPGGPTSA